MCGRFALHANPEVVALQFGLGMTPKFIARFNIAPGSEVLAVREIPGDGRVAELHRWGLVPAWAKDPAIGNRLANARGETLAEKPSFRSAFRRRRCLVPASGFYEWRAEAGRKRPFYIRPAQDGDLFGIAGIAESWNGPDGPLRTVSLVTTAANELMAPIHERMPVLIAPDDYAVWLDPRVEDVPALMRLIRPYPSLQMRLHPVSARINSPKNDDAGLLAQAEP